MMEGRSKATKIVAGIIGTIVLGALGSGFWDLALKSSLFFLMSAALNLSTLGLNSLKDDVYIMVARQDTARASLETLYLVTLLIIGLISAFIAYVDGKIAALKRKREPPEMRQESIQRAEETIVRAVRVLAICAGIVIVTLMFRFIKLSYANAAALYFHQSLTICRPMLTDEQEKMFLARFAAMNSRRDYIDLLSDLEETSKRYGKELPPFRIW